MNVQSVLEQYMRQAQQIPMLRVDEEQELAECWQATQDRAAAERLLGSHLRLVIKIARGFCGYGLPLDELIAEGSVGMMQALTRFEPARGFRFATYASWWIKAAIREYVLRNRSLVRMGTTAAQKRLFFNLRRLKSDLGELGDGDLLPASVTRIARELEVSEAEVVDMNRRLSASDQSLAKPIGADSDLQWEDMLESDDDTQDDAVAEASEFAWRRSLLTKSMSKLTDRERHILSERRLSDGPKTLNELSQTYGVSRERIRQIEVRAFEKVQAATLKAAANRTIHAPTHH
ncbi:MAG: RNA polymerase factor sigma-32 [Alphaproteobacteria bacterium]|nr:RNA polymerase factor sigma-32 [Alphaproteobacteria bacterium]